MKILFSFIAFSIFQLVNAQSLAGLEGSWELISENETPVSLTTVRIYQDGFFAEGTKEGDYDFKSAKGGFYKQGESIYTEKFEFDSDDSLKVGTTQDDLSGVWIITGRERNGEMQRREIGDRKTIKILSGTRFQWIAYNSATGQFFATGGGSYLAKYGRYIENIEFFSKDDFRVGASLTFDYQIMNKEWNHRGKSSAGEPINEIWSPYQPEETIAD